MCFEKWRHLSHKPPCACRAHAHTHTYAHTQTWDMNQVLQ